MSTLTLPLSQPHEVTRRRLSLRDLLLVEVLYDPGDIRPRFIIRRHSAKLFHALRPGVVGCQSFDQVEVVSLQQLSQISGPAINVGLRIECVGHSQL